MKRHHKYITQNITVWKIQAAEKDHVKWKVMGGMVSGKRKLKTGIWEEDELREFREKIEIGRSRHAARKT